MEELTASFVKNELVKVAIPHKTVIVNNAATSGSNDKLCKSLNATLITDIHADCDTTNDVYVISAEENLGFACGNNLGAEFCHKFFDPYYILFTNNDIQLSDDNVVGELIKKLHFTPEAGVIGPKVVGPNGKAQSPNCFYSCWDLEVWQHWSSLFLSKKKQTERFCLDYAQKATEGYHYFVSGCFFLVRAADFYKCEMFDPNTFLYAEERILSERMKAIDKGVYYYPKVSVTHAHGMTTKSHTKKRQVLKWKTDSNIYYYRNYCHTRRSVLFLARLTMCLVSLRR